MTFWIAAGSTSGQETSSQQIIRNGPGFVLLKNGEVLKGDVRSLEGFLQIRLDDTASVTMNRNQVDFVGSSLDELYLVQVNRPKRWTFGDHLQLARWSAKQGLFHRAMPHYNQLQAEIPNTTEFRQFDVEFRNMMLADKTMQAALKSAGLSTGPVNDASFTESSDSSNAATLASDTSKVEPTKPITTATPSTAFLNQSEQEVFVHDIQPVLASSCARSACHGAFGSTSFSLLDGRRMDSKSAYRQNLQAFTECLQRNKGTAEAAPESHILFVKSITPHGLQMTAPLDVTNPTHQKYLDQLRLWIARVNSGGQISSQELVAKQNPDSPQWWSPPSIPVSRVQQPGTNTSANGSSPPILGGNEIESLAAAIARMEAIEKERTAKKDPFDPNEFNSKYK